MGEGRDVVGERGGGGFLDDGEPYFSFIFDHLLNITDPFLYSISVVLLL